MVNPDVVGDITEAGLPNTPQYKSAFGDQKFKKVVFEHVPIFIFDTPEKCATIAQNMVGMVQAGGSIWLQTGIIMNSELLLQTMAQCFANNGFHVTKLEPQNGLLCATKMV